MNWVTPPPPSKASVIPPHLGPRVETSLAYGEGDGGGDPIQTTEQWTDTLVLYLVIPLRVNLLRGKIQRRG